MCEGFNFEPWQVGPPAGDHAGKRHLKDLGPRPCEHSCSWHCPRSPGLQRLVAHAPGLLAFAENFTPAWLRPPLPRTPFVAAAYLGKPDRFCYLPGRQGFAKSITSPTWSLYRCVIPRCRSSRWAGSRGRTATNWSQSVRLGRWMRALQAAKPCFQPAQRLGIRPAVYTAHGGQGSLLVHPLVLSGPLPLPPLRRIEYPAIGEVVGIAEPGNFNNTIRGPRPSSRTYTQPACQMRRRFPSTVATARDEMPRIGSLGSEPLYVRKHSSTRMLATGYRKGWLPREPHRRPQVRLAVHWRGPLTPGRRAWATRQT